MHRRTFITLGLGTAVAGVVSCLPDNKHSKLLQADQHNPLAALKRLSLGFSLNEANDILTNGGDGLIKQLHVKSNKLGYPINFEFTEDRTVPIGETWIDAVYRLDIFYEQYRKKSLRAWLVQELLQNNDELRMQMLLFWLNHFAISDVIEHKFEYIHINLLYTNSLGNIRQLIKEITIDPAMLRYLNGAENKKNSPNENYARELLELFTIGKGIQIGEGNYTTFTEEDVRACAKILTGWRDKAWFTLDENLKPGAEFDKYDHDDSNKSLSRAFNYAVIDANAEQEFKNLIDVIFSRKETALHFAQKLVTWFVTDEPVKHESLVCKVADILYDADYEMKPAITYLMDCGVLNNTTDLRIKSPVQFVVGLLKAIPVTVPADIKQSNNFYYALFKSISEMGMELLKPPGVAGWKAYYQYPALSKQWINASSQIKRTQFIKNLFFDGIEAHDILLKADIIALLNQFKSKNVAQLINTAIYYFHPIYDPNLAKDLTRNLQHVCSDTSWNKSLNNGTYTVEQKNAITQALYNIVVQPQTNLI